MAATALQTFTRPSPPIWPASVTPCSPLGGVPSTGPFPTPRPSAATPASAPTTTTRKAEPMEWTHTICTVCWSAREPGRLPVTVSGVEPEPCCFCGQMTDAGIYVRHDPRTLNCTHTEG